ncbi:hypothetical protein L0Y65_05600 [Candidatus Micrarchaeota archaeon]|nr:hypothetical protein [Candidatus Micrarchaeota archaeon]
MEEDKELKEAVAACVKIIEEKCGRRPFMLVVSKANVRFENEEARQKGIISGTSTYMYQARPKLAKNGLSKMLIDTCRVALNRAEKAATGSAES